MVFAGQKPGQRPRGFLAVAFAYGHITIMSYPGEQGIIQIPLVISGDEDRIHP